MTTTSLLFHVPMNSCELANPVSLAAHDKWQGVSTQASASAHNPTLISSVGTLLFQALDWERSK